MVETPCLENNLLWGWGDETIRFDWIFSRYYWNISMVLGLGSFAALVVTLLTIFLRKSGRVV